MAAEINEEIYKDGIAVIVVKGDVGGSDTILFREMIQKQADSDTAKLIIDLSLVTYLDSSWLGAFIFAMGLFDDMGKMLYFVITNKFVMDLFENSNLSSIANIVESKEKIENS